MKDIDTAIALNRFGLGARPDQPAPADPKRWLLDQFGRYEVRPAAWAAMRSTPDLARDFTDDRMDMKTSTGDAKAAVHKQLRDDSMEVYRQGVNARGVSAIMTSTPFVERLVHFWANHFALSAEKLAIMPYIASFEAEAIRPNVLGKFETMLLAVERHVGMELYLDQDRSVGPDSPFAVRAAAGGKKRGLNENLAREIMELHTLGVRSGYTQADVTELARAMTGWGIGGLGQAPRTDGGQPGTFQFRAGLHEPGRRTILGKVYDQQGEAQARAIFHDLAVAPATANHIATKLARHFVADDPPPALVRRLSDAYRASGGDLPTLYRTLIEAPEAWAPAPAKFKTPWDWFLSVGRGIGMRELGEVDVSRVMQQLGQPVWKPGSPAGYDDIAASWAAPDALVRRVEVAQRFASRIGDRLSSDKLAPQLLGGTLSEATAKAIAGADSPPTGLVLLFVSPEFQRR
jgi:uncharacterized protein (DUF1800 family)